MEATTERSDISINDGYESDFHIVAEAALQVSGKSFYRYFIEGRRAVFPPAMAECFHIPLEVDDWPQFAAGYGCLQPETLNAWFMFFEAIDRGEKNGAAEILFRSEIGENIHYRLQFVSVADAAGKAVYALVFVEDISQAWQNNRLLMLERDSMIGVVQKMFSEVLAVNLTRNTFRFLQRDSSHPSQTPAQGCMDAAIASRSVNIAPEDRSAFLKTFSRSHLLHTFTVQDQKSIDLTYRRKDQDGVWRWIESTVIRQDNSFDDDILCIALSRNVDEQKAREAQLKRELHLQEEELRLTLDQMGKTLNYYDIASHTLHTSPAFAGPRGLPEKIFNYPESLPALSRETFPPESMKALIDMYGAIRRGEPRGGCEIAVTGENGEERWERLTFVTIFDDDNRPSRAVVSIEDISHLHSQAEENRRLRENERMLNIAAQHSNRVFCYYDIQLGRARQWDERHCAACMLPRLCEIPYTEILGDERFFPESLSTLEAMFRDIHFGVPKGECKLHCKDSNGRAGWYGIKYTTIHDADQKPQAALISFMDITEQYERELAYQRHVQSIKNSADQNILLLEADLSSSVIEQQGGALLPGTDLTGIMDQVFLAKILPCFQEEDREPASQLFLPQYLLTQHAAGIHHLENTWQVSFPDRKKCWLQIRVDMVVDPYSSHVKSFFHIEDITAQKEEQIAMQRRAEQDGMTGLLNRNTCEERIRKLVDKSKIQSSGVLVVVDLDDLKGINDNLGHEQGDKAIKAIAETLKSHFRKDDIIGRLGGDEFMAYLPGAGGNEAAMALSLSSMLQKLSQMSVGKNNERNIHCSIGCATERPGQDTFESLYKRADLALYHIKRGGKNNVAFYRPDMEITTTNFATEK